MLFNLKNILHVSFFLFLSPNIRFSLKKCINIFKLHSYYFTRNSKIAINWYTVHGQTWLICHFQLILTNFEKVSCVAEPALIWTIRLQDFIWCLFCFVPISTCVFALRWWWFSAYLKCISSSKSIAFPPPCLLKWSCTLFCHALPCSDKVVCSFLLVRERSCGYFFGSWLLLIHAC